MSLGKCNISRLLFGCCSWDLDDMPEPHPFPCFVSLDKKDLGWLANSKVSPVPLKCVKVIHPLVDLFPFQASCFYSGGTHLQVWGDAVRIVQLFYVGNLPLFLLEPVRFAFYLLHRCSINSLLWGHLIWDTLRHTRAVFLLCLLVGFQLTKLFLFLC